MGQRVVIYTVPLPSCGSNTMATGTLSLHRVCLTRMPAELSSGKLKGRSGTRADPVL